MDRAARATERFLWPRVAADMLRLFEAPPAP
jgi:hypothetical protein